MSQWHITIATLALLLAGTMTVACQGAEGPETLEHDLAVIHEGKPVKQDAPIVATFAQLLDDLDAKCQNSPTVHDSRQQVADMTVAANRLLKDRGVKEPLLTTMRAVNAAIPAEAKTVGGIDCADAFAAYATMRIGGR